MVTNKYLIEKHGFGYEPITNWFHPTPKGKLKWQCYCKNHLGLKIVKSGSYLVVIKTGLKVYFPLRGSSILEVNAFLYKVKKDVNSALIDNRFIISSQAIN